MFCIILENKIASANLVSNRIKLLCSSRGIEESYTSNPVSLAAKAWLNVAGWNPSTQNTRSMLADTNGDNKIPLKELYIYSYNRIVKESNEKRHVVSSSPKDDFVIFGRY